MTLLRVDFGSLKWPDNLQKYSYILLEFEVINEESLPIRLQPEPFELKLKIGRKWIGFQKMYIPLSGTVLYKNKNDRSGANIDHADLQKFKVLNVGQLYGIYETHIKKLPRYLNSTHYLLFLSTEVSTNKIKEAFSKVKKEKLPINIIYRDYLGNPHKPCIIIRDSPKLVDPEKVTLRRWSHTALFFDNRGTKGKSGTKSLLLAAATS